MHNDQLTMNVLGGDTTDDGAIAWQVHRAGRLFVAVPEGVESLQRELESFSAIETLKAVETPADILQILLDFPLVSALDGVYLFPSFSRQSYRDGHVGRNSDSGDRIIHIDISASDKMAAISHEVGHLILDGSPDTHALYQLACILEADMEGVVQETVSDSAENWAYYFGAGLMVADGVEFEQFCHGCPIRAMMMARCVLGWWQEQSTAGWVFELKSRLEFIGDSITTIGQLMLITSVYAAQTRETRDYAVTLLLRYGADEQLQMLSAVTELNLARSALTAGELHRVRALNLLEKLDLGDTPITDSTVAELYCLSNLARLSLRNTAISSLSLSALVELPLIELDLRGTRINDDAGIYLTMMGQLKLLRLSKDALSPQYVAIVTEALPACEITLE